MLPVYQCIAQPGPEQGGGQARSVILKGPKTNRTPMLA